VFSGDIFFGRTGAFSAVRSVFVKDLLIDQPSDKFLEIVRKELPQYQTRSAVSIVHDFKQYQ
jgi:hypothetical protein